ncbi:MAG: heme-binding protein [Myxococcota bacterium]|nr:heme-binding protein [Myxococcota bacterium]
MKRTTSIFQYFCAAVVLSSFIPFSSWAQGLPSHEQLRAALRAVVQEDNGGFGLHMWATVVNRDGVVMAVVFSGEHRGDQWPGSRVISAQKANTANAFSLPGLSLSTANLFSAVQPGGSLYGLQHSNPVDTKVAYGGRSWRIGTPHDPMTYRKIGGVNVFGGGLALYNAAGELIGAIGVSGDSSCADHNIAWKVRDALNLDYVPGGVSATGDDNIAYDIFDGVSTSGWGHPVCSSEAKTIGENLPTTHPINPL